MKRVLIVEDEDILMSLLAKKLTREGYDVILARDGKEGLEKVKSDRPDLILLDIVMPRMGGFEVMSEIDRDPELKNIPIIVISNSGQPVELDRAQQLGARDWLVKTEFDPQEVIVKIKKQIGE